MQRTLCIAHRSDLEVLSRLSSIAIHKSALPRSRYEQVFIRAISGRKLRIGRDWFTPTGMRGWSQVIFTRDRDNTRHVFSLDYLLRHLDDWDVGPRAARRIRRSLRERLDRRQ